MNLYSEHPYWLMKNGLISSYNSLDHDLKTDIVIMGAGISGALIAYSLRHSGYNITVVDRRHVGMGSTAASTAFLQYEIDTPLTRLTDLVGERDAVRSYQLCREAIYDIRDICHDLGGSFDFHIRPSIQFATYESHLAGLEKEYHIRRQHGFDIDWLSNDDLANEMNLQAAGAVRSADGGEVDAYRLTHALLASVYKCGHHVYNNTEIRDIQHTKSGLILKTTQGAVIRAARLIVACGYESLKYIPKHIADIHTTYALVSQPITGDFAWKHKSLVWETATPYLYFRVVNKDRILVGGRDDNHHHPHMQPSVIRRKAAMLEQAFCNRMPHIPLKTDFAWSGAFAVTPDGLPYIGTLPYNNHIWFALGFGGNGITFSAIAARIISDAIHGRHNEYASIFRFDRK